MIAYHGDPKIKTDILAKLVTHRKADEIVRGYYWENGKGCAVGCTIESGDHSKYETLFGIPIALAYVAGLEPPWRESEAEAHSPIRRV